MYPDYLDGTVLFYPLPVQLLSSIGDDITKLRLQWRPIGGSGTGSVHASSKVWKIGKHSHPTNESPHSHTISGDSHTHTTNESPHTHTISGDSHTHTTNESPHTHTTNESPHTHTISGDSHTHTTNESPHTHTISGDSHTHTISGDSHNHPVSGGGTGTVKQTTISIDKDDS